MNTLYAIQAPQQCELLVAFSDLSAFKHFAQSLERRTIIRGDV